MEGYRKILAEVFGQPIDPNMAADPVATEIADFPTVEPEKDFKVYTSADANAGDIIYTATSDGTVVTRKVTPGTPTAVTFSGMETYMEYVLLDDIVDTPDQTVLANRKAAQERAMNKKELAEIFALILAVSGQEVTQGSTEDIYHVLYKLIRKVSHYGTDLLICVGSTVKETIDKYARDNADNFYYLPKIEDLLASYNAKLVEVTSLATYKVTTGGAATPVLAATKAVIVARQSSLPSDIGKPVQFARRLIRPEIAAEAGLTVGEGRARATIIEKALTQVDGTDGKLGYGVMMYEKRASALVSSYRIAWATVS